MLVYGTFASSRLTDCWLTDLRYRRRINGDGGFPTSERNGNIMGFLQPRSLKRTLGPVSPGNLPILSLPREIRISDHPLSPLQCNAKGSKVRDPQLPSRGGCHVTPATSFSNTPKTITHVLRQHHCSRDVRASRFSMRSRRADGWHTMWGWSDASPFLPIEVAEGVDRQEIGHSSHPPTEPSISINHVRAAR